MYINDQTIYLYGGNNNIYKTSLSSTGLTSSKFNQIKIYPNPSNGTIQLELEKVFVGKEIKLFFTCLCLRLEWLLQTSPRDPIQRWMHF